MATPPRRFWRRTVRRTYSSSSTSFAFSSSQPSPSSSSSARPGIAETAVGFRSSFGAFGAPFFPRFSGTSTEKEWWQMLHRARNTRPWTRSSGTK